MTNNPSGFDLTSTQLSGNTRLGVNNVTSIPNVANPKSIGQPSANGYSQLPNNPKYTPFVDYKSANPVVNQSQAVQTTARTVGTNGVAGRALGAIGLILSAPQIASDFGTALGFFANLPQLIKNQQERDRLNNLLKQREAIAMDSARTNNIPEYIPPFFGGQTAGVEYLIRMQILRGNANFGFTEAIAIGKITSVELIHPSTIGGTAMIVITGNPVVYLSVNISDPSTLRLANITVTRRSGIDSSGNLPSSIPSSPPPPYPNRSNWEYDQVPVVDKDPIVQPVVKPVTPSKSVKPFKEPDKPKPFDVQQPDTSKNPNIVQNPNGFVQIFPTSFTTTGVNDQPQKVAKKEPSLFEQATADFDKYYAYPISPGHGLVRGVNSDFGASPDTLKVKGFIVVKQPQKPETIYDKGTQTVPNSPSKPPDTRTPNTTPDTPVKQTENDNNLPQTIAALLGITALLGAMKVGSDAFINASLPKINNIENNTTPTAQQTNAKQGVCDAMQPNQCGFEGVKQATTEATNPIKDIANDNKSVLAGLVAQLIALAKLITDNFTKLFDFLDINAKVEAVKSTITLALTLHNALMLSQSLGTTLGAILDNVLNIFGNTFRDSNGNQIGASTYLGATVQQWIINVIGAANYAALSETLAIANRIYQTGMNIVSTVQSILDSAASVAQATGINVSKIGNALRDDGVVAPKAYTHMDDTAAGNRGTPLTRFTQLTTAISDADSKAQNLVTITAAPIQIKDAIKQSKDDVKAFNDARDVNSEANKQAKEEKIAQIKELKAITEATISKRDDDS